MRTSRLVSAVFIIFFTISFSVPAFAAAVSPGLQATLQQVPPGQEVPVIITLADKENISQFKDHDKEVRRNKIVAALKDKADKTQGQLKAFLQGRSAKRVKPFWITNAIAATIPASMVNELASFHGVETVETDAVVSVPPVTPSAAVAPLAANIEWNMSQINAPMLWNAGITGAGAVVANVDTGVDPLHADLTGKWRGGSNSWYSVFTILTNASYCATPNHCTPCELSATPCDVDGHGTGTMGVMVGGSAGGTTIGVAPGAKWIAVKIFNDASADTQSSLILDAYTWLVSLPAGSAPDVINNSYGGGPGFCDTYLQSAIATLRASGIEVIFSAGNEGPNPSTDISPANNIGAFAVGMTDINNNIASLSSRGPNTCDRSIFPHVVAPGVNIKLADLTSGGLFPTSYVHGYGTSFSAPHVAGATALLMSTLPSLTPDQIEDAFKQTALPLPPLAPSPNNDYGYGLIDVAEAYKYAFATYSGKGDVPQIAAMPSSSAFDAVVGTTSASTTFTIVNQGSADLVINQGGISITGTSDFAVAAENCSGMTIPSLLSCTVSVVFQPSALGSQSAQLSIASNDPVSGTLNLALTGTAWASLTGPSPSVPGIAWNDTDGKFHVVRRKMTNAIAASTISASGVFNNDWVTLPSGTTADTPAVVWDVTDKRLAILIRGTGNRIYGATTDSSGGSFSGWTAISTFTTSAAPSVAWNPVNDKLYIAVMGSDNAIYLAKANPTFTTFRGWIKLPSLTTFSSPSVSWNPTGNKLQIVARGGDNRLYGATVDAAMSSFSGWTPILKKTTPVGPAIAWDPLGMVLHIAMRAANTLTYTGTVDSFMGSFSGWTQLAPEVYPGPPGVALNTSTGRLMVILRRADNTLVTRVP